MRYFVVFIFLLVNLSSYLAAPFFPHNIRLVNGINATPGQFPYAVSVRYKNCHECGGSIIGSKWVLTAAHCIYSDFINVSTILYGTVDIHNCNQASPNVTKIVKQAIVHENYQPYGGYFNDIALIEVEEPFQFSNTVQPVSLPHQCEPSPTLTDSILVGWGYPQVDVKNVSQVLQMVDIMIFPYQVCNSYFGANFSEWSHICAGVPGGGTGQCTGDSGGALTVDGVQYGIVSWSDKPCAITPGVMTRVASFRYWIEDITGI